MRWTDVKIKNIEPFNYRKEQELRNSRESYELMWSRFHNTGASLSLQTKEEYYSHKI